MKILRIMKTMLLALGLCALLFFTGALAARAETYSVSLTVPEGCSQVRLSAASTGRTVEGTEGTVTLEDVPSGDTVTVRVVPQAFWKVFRMKHTILLAGGKTMMMPLPVSEAGDHAAEGSFTMASVETEVEVTMEKDSIPYMSFDSQGNSLGEKECERFIEVHSGEQNWVDLNEDEGGWYVVRSDATFSSHTTLRVTGDVHLILCDGTTLTVGDGIYIKRGSSLSIYGQSGGTGKLISKPDSGPGIGGMADTVGGSLYIHGGVIDVKGGTNAAGIGGGNHQSGYENIVIYGGKVTAVGGSSGAGIGKGQQNASGDCGTIAIYGGEVTASSAKNAAGIGGGEDRDGGTIEIHGGKVTASGGEYGAGIGGGNGGNGGSIAIYGGTIDARGGKQAAGIGGGHTTGNGVFSGFSGGKGGSIHIVNGYIEARGGSEAAGIGGGFRGNNGTVTIDGGTVKAIGGKNGAGIGGGVDGSGGIVAINGGTVTATWEEQGNRSAFAIGRGYNESYKDNQLGKGTLSLYEAARVNGVSADHRAAACQSHTAVTIAPCAHEGHTYAITDAGHTEVCRYCMTGFQEEAHTFVMSDTCNTCGYAGDMVHVTYLPGSDLASGEMDAASCVPGTVYYIRDCGFVLSGCEFTGWQLDATDTILSAGQEYPVEANITLTATWRRSAWSELQEAIDGAAVGAVIQLDRDMAAGIGDGALVIPAGAALTLDLNGFTLDRALTQARPEGQVIINEGALTITDSAGGGTITGGWSDGTDGGCIANHGTLTLADGTIVDNHAMGSAGAVLNAAGAAFHMTGGSLKNNTCGRGGGGAVVNYGTMTLSGGTIAGNLSGQNGGGIWSNGTLSISGGTIVDNAADDKGGGLYARGDGNLALSGAPVIAGNSTAGRGENNIHLNVDGGHQATIAAGALEEGLRAGLSSTTVPSAASPVPLVTGLLGGAGGFFSDSAGYMLIREDGALKLAEAPAFGTADLALPSDLAAIGAEAFEGVAAGVVDIPEGCVSIGDRALRNCPNLTHIRIPADCSLGADVFDGCPLVYVYGTAGSPAEACCMRYDNCVFVAES